MADLDLLKEQELRQEVRKQRESRIGQRGKEEQGTPYWQQAWGEASVDLGIPGRWAGRGTGAPRQAPKRGKRSALIPGAAVPQMVHKRGGTHGRIMPSVRAWLRFPATPGTVSLSLILGS
jgi:hypothetical protein